MKPLIKALFIVFDILAWLLFAATVLSVLAFVFLGPVEARDGNYEVSRLEIWVTCIIAACFAAGAFAVARRRPIGIFLLSLPVLPCLYIGELLFGALFLCLVLAVFGTPFFLAFMEARHHIRPMV